MKWMSEPFDVASTRAMTLRSRDQLLARYPDLEEAALVSILARSRPCEPPRPRGPRLADLAQPGVAGKPEGCSRSPGLFEQVHDLGRTVVAIAAHGNFDPRPVAPDAADDVLEDTRRHSSTGRPLAGTQ